jgi:hypothetical protein
MHYISLLHSTPQQSQHVQGRHQFRNAGSSSSRSKGVLVLLVQVEVSPAGAPTRTPVGSLGEFQQVSISASMYGSSIGAGNPGNLHL